MLFIFPKIPRLVHPCYLGRMGAPDYVPTQEYCKWKINNNLSVKY